METIALLGVNISRVDLVSAAEQVMVWVRSKRQTYVCLAPVSTLVEAQADQQYAQVLNKAGMVTPDGMPVVWLAKLKGAKNIDRAYGPDLMHQLCRLGQAQNIRHFFYGGTASTLARLQERLQALYPKIAIVGAHAPGFSPQTQAETPVVLERLNACQPDIVWVGLGSPKQDFWMSMHRPQIKAPVMIGAGAAFDFVAGVKPQAPKWMQRGGLEWLFRLATEPRRLWKRYLIGNSLFVWYVVKDLFKKAA